MGSPATAEPTMALQPARTLAAMLTATARTAVLIPFTRRAGAELVLCAVGVPLALSLLALSVWVLGAPVLVGLITPRFASTWVAALVMVPGFVLLVLLAPRTARGLSSLDRRLTARLLGERIASPPPLVPARPGLVGWLRAGLRDGPGWRAVAYAVLKLPVAALKLYAVFLWIAGLINLSYPFWWQLFRHHPPDVRLSAVPASTPFPGSVFHIATFDGTFAAFAVGAAMVLAAPWVTRAVVAVDLWLMRGLLGPDGLARRVRELEQTRALAVDDAAAVLRRVERDLHDGAQIRLATLAMNLGLAKDELGEGGDPDELTRIRELVDAAHRSAKDALRELRHLARGIHPPVLDAGLQDALSSLASGSAVPIALSTDLRVRPTPAIETIAYFCAAELLANAAKHSSATAIQIHVGARRGDLILSVADDGTGGAAARPGSGLSGLAQRLSTVDGRLDISSPPGGPTTITVVLPLRA